MRTKSLILIGVVAVATLSFTFSKVNVVAQKATSKSAATQAQTAPVGGFVSDALVK